ncbi:MAG TPA: DMT family transporter, partial [Blastocatellia bacterium]|nr:DMT family transporter [Blastocatellia bacterium]
AFLSNVGLSNIGGALLGAIAAILMLATGNLQLTGASSTFFYVAIVLLGILFFVRLFKERGIDQLHRWGIISLALLGFGVGTLIYLLRQWGVWLWMEFREASSWLWMEFRKIDEPHEWLLTSFFLIGMILGFFVVRNWSKDQTDFVKSLTAVFGGAFVTTLIGTEVDGIGKQPAFAYYAIGFTVSAVLNLAISSWLIASYSERKTITSRSVLSFLYGTDKAEAVDKQFLKNFEEDPVYARRMLINTVLEYEKRVIREFANKRELKRREQEANGNLRYYELISIEPDRPAPAPPAPAPPAPAPPAAAPPAPAPAPAQPPPDTPISGATPMMVVFRKIPDTEKLTEKMFRSWVQLKWQDNLETIDAAAAFSQPFPYLFSVTGLALDTLNTIVMERDKYKRFRSTQYPHGIAPAKIEQPRGLTEIDYLSYITVPVASDMGQPEQTKLGVLDVDTKLFAVKPADLKIISEDNGVCTARMSPDELNQLANNLYDQKDAGVEYLEDMRAVLVPVLKLYLRCRQGST